MILVIFKPRNLLRVITLLAIMLNLVILLCYLASDFLDLAHFITIIIIRGNPAARLFRFCPDPAAGILLQTYLSAILFIILFTFPISNGFS